MLGDMTTKVGRPETADVVGKFGVDGVNMNGNVDVCAERELFMTNTLLEHKMIHRYTWARGNETSLIDYRAKGNKLRREIQDAKIVREMFSGSDHFAAGVKVRMRW